MRNLAITVSLVSIAALLSCCSRSASTDSPSASPDGPNSIAVVGASTPTPETAQTSRPRLAPKPTLLRRGPTQYWYTLTSPARLYAECVNLVQDLVTEDPSPKVLATLRSGAQIHAEELAWSQVDYKSTTYLYTRDTQDIRVRTKSGLDGCVSFNDTLNDDGSTRDAGLKTYLGAFMNSYEPANIVAVGQEPKYETIDHLDSVNHYSNTKDLDSAEGLDF